MFALKPAQNIRRSFRKKMPAIIIPDGILANSNLHYVRQYIAENTKVNAIISLPRDTFKQMGTSAKTSIMFLTKSKDKIRDTNYPVFLASAQRIEYLEKIYPIFKEVYIKWLK